MSRLAFILALLEFTLLLRLLAKYGVSFFQENSAELFHSRCSLEDALKSRAYTINTIMLLMVSSILKWMPK